nr:orf121d [Eruca vesicaria subsp. sativa]AGY62796.1 orf121b [Eruca vesicaria subsp. sativa]
MTHGYGSGQYELRGFNAARELLHLRFSGCRRWGLDKRKGMSSFSGMVSEMASLPSDGASDLPLEMQYMGFHGSISWFRGSSLGERAAFQEEPVTPARMPGWNDLTTNSILSWMPTLQDNIH